MPFNIAVGTTRNLGWSVHTEKASRAPNAAGSHAHHSSLLYPLRASNSWSTSFLTDDPHLWNLVLSRVQEEGLRSTATSVLRCPAVARYGCCWGHKKRNIRSDMKPDRRGKTLLVPKKRRPFSIFIHFCYSHSTPNLRTKGSDGFRILGKEIVRGPLLAA